VNPSEPLVTAEVEEVCSGEAPVVVRFEEDHLGAGRVLVRRRNLVHPFVVWRWATKLTDGSPVRTPTGAMLWSGGYYASEAEAIIDLRSRGRTR